jgi:hypothetical protein
MLSVVKLSVVMLSVVMLSVIMLNVVMLSVVAPLKKLARDKHSSLFCCGVGDEEKEFVNLVTSSTRVDR